MNEYQAFFVCACVDWISSCGCVCVLLCTFPPSDELFSYPQYTHQAHSDKPKHSHYNRMCVIECVRVDQLLSLCFKFFLRPSKRGPTSLYIHCLRQNHFISGKTAKSTPSPGFHSDTQTCTNILVHGSSSGYST